MALFSPPGKRPFGLTDADLTSLVEQIKQMQRNDMTAKVQWSAYCDSAGGGVRDPAKHGAEFIQDFITRFDNGERLEVTASSSGGSGGSSSLLTAVKEAQRRSKPWKDAWATYCDARGRGQHDPAKHDSSFVVGFLDFAGQQATMALQQLNQSMALDPSGGSDMALQSAQLQMLQVQQQMLQAQQAVVQMPDAKRQRTGVVASLLQSAGTGIGAGGDKAELVSRVKEFQRSGEEATEAWWAFCDQHMGGVRDPARHEETSILTFLASQGIAASSPTPMASPVGMQAAMGMQVGGMQRGDEWDAVRVALAQQAAMQAAQQAMAMGMQSMAQPALGNEFETNPLPMAQHAFGNEFDTASLAMQINAYQRSSQETNEYWWDPTTFAGSHGGP